MAKKNNTSARQLDLTAYTFVQTCGGCHPGGGAAESDRNGRRYDLFAADPGNKIVSGGVNAFDGDYYKARWSESGVLEADCLLCHLPGYGFARRKEQVQRQNFRWAATAGAGFAAVTGSVGKGEQPTVGYDAARFQSDGRVALHMVREVPIENCLHCHREPDWKKKGASYSHRTDVHLRAGLKCVDCHVTGRKASDRRIRGREVHQIGKGDDPTGLVRDDLDNTMRSCESCHLEGELRTKVAVHKGLPPIHLEKIACLTCHVPQRQAKAALLQDSTVFNSTPRIAAAGKRIWTFYGPDMKPWNLYGETAAFTAERQPLFTYAPVRAWYKGKIYPLNRIDSIWLAIVDQAGKITGQPYMKDLYKMWAAHRADPAHASPGLATIVDDNGDGAPEANRSSEIKALLKAATAYLHRQGEVLEGKRLAYVSGTRYTVDGRRWEALKVAPAPWQYTAYSSVFKLSHDIMPARSALGAGGCTDCHSASAQFWRRPVMVRPFNGDAATSSWMSNAQLLGVTDIGVWMGALRHGTLEGILFYSLLIVFALLLLILLANGLSPAPAATRRLTTDPVMRLMLAILGVALAGPGIVVVFGALLPSEVIGTLGTIHEIVAGLFVLAFLVVIARGAGTRTWLFIAGCTGVVFMTATGIVLVFSDAINLRQIVFTLHDLGAVVLVGLATAALLSRVVVPGIGWRSRSELKKQS